MFHSTLPKLRCPQLLSRKPETAKKRQSPAEPRPLKGQSPCEGKLALEARETQNGDIRSGTLTCVACGSQYPILAGVAIVLLEPLEYLLAHAKGVSQFIAPTEIPHEIRDEFAHCLAEQEEQAAQEHQEEDLEAERVNALYLMNHYLRVSPEGERWWEPRASVASPLHSELIEKYWNQGPIAKVAEWVQELTGDSSLSVVELGCGVGGVWRELRTAPEGAKIEYLGLDSAFASIVRARHFGLGAAPSVEARIPEDLLAGGVTRPVTIVVEQKPAKNVDFIVADVENPPLAAEAFDASIAMNVIDMLENPARFPKIQAAHLKTGGRALQSGPYIWHARIAGKLRSQLPRGISDSAAAVEYFYEKAGFSLERKEGHIPWLFFKHARQLELYSVHLLQGRKQ